MKRLTITGYLGRDPERSADNDGSYYANFSVAVSVGTKQNPKTDWVEVSCKNALADVILNYTKKGSKVLVDGYPSSYAYLSQSGEIVHGIKLFANNIELMSRAEKGDELKDADSVINNSDGGVHKDAIGDNEYPNSYTE